MRIAVTSQNRRTVTPHAGKCRNFWVYEVECGDVTGRQLIELPLDQTLHARHHDIGANPLEGINVLIAGSMGEGLLSRLSSIGVQPIITTEQDPDIAVAKWLLGLLKSMPVSAARCGHAH
jgi:predicted Fe-Mo cluster-binding NifX family protein